MSNKKLLLTVICAVLLCAAQGNVFAQFWSAPSNVIKSEPVIKKASLRAGSAKPMQITNAFGGPINSFVYNYPVEYQGYLTDYIKKYPDSQLIPGGYLVYGNIQDPSFLLLDTQVITPVKVKYSLYTYKKTFAQDGKRNYYQGIDECGTVNPITTQAQIDSSLDKIYELPAVMETASGYKELPWNGYTDPKFTGQKYAVRDCVYIAAYNADTGELIDTQVTGIPTQIYGTGSAPGMEYRIDEHKDINGKVDKETLSAKILVAYPDDWPIKKLTAFIITEGCGFGALTFDVINQGADAIAADINRRLPGDVPAHITLTNPTVDKDNPNIKVFDWKDIKTEDGKDFIPDLVKYPRGYSVAIIVDMDEMTFTGIKNGSMSSNIPLIPPMPKSYTDIKNVNASKGMKITQTPTGFKVDCDGGVCANKLSVYNTAGALVKQVPLSGNQSTQEVSTELRDGIYIVKTDGTNNGRPESATLKVVKKN
jgi:hypothetical protein